MKKLFSIISAALALCTLAITAGCTGGQPSKTDSSDQGSVSETPKDTVAPAKADTSTTEAEVKTDAPTTTEAVADYRNPFINALLESPAFLTLIMTEKMNFLFGRAAARRT